MAGCSGEESLVLPSLHIFSDSKLVMCSLSPCAWEAGGGVAPLPWGSVWGRGSFQGARFGGLPQECGTGLFSKELGSHRRNRDTVN